MILGIIIGLLIAILVAIITKRYQTSFERTVKQISNKTASKGEIFGLEDTSLEDIMEQFKE